jgi:uncharacterized protein YegJ (DUF2314 family)
MANKEIFWVDGENPKMIEARKNAQKTFKYFWRELCWERKRIVRALNIACVKITFTQETEDIENPIVEYMWINEVMFDGNNVTGVLINNPNELTNASKGDFISVTINQISDWLFALNYKTYGGFTIQAMRSEMTNQERKEHDNAWGLDFGDFNDVLFVYEQKEHPENLIEHPMSKNMREKLIDFLKQYPNEVTYFDENGLTLLHKETIAGNLTSVEVLLAAGADKNVKTNLGETALDLAKKVNWEHIIPILES